MLYEEMKELGQPCRMTWDLFIQVAGSQKGGVVLSKIMMWFDVKDKFYKTDKELMSEVFLRLDEFRAAKERIKNYPLSK